MSKTSSYTDESCEIVKKEIISILTERLHFPNNPLISYSDLAKRITTTTIEADSQKLFKILDQINREEYERGKRMLTVLVINKKKSIPGKGFFELAKELHPEYTNKENDYIFYKELNALLADHKKACQ